MSAAGRVPLPTLLAWAPSIIGAAAGLFLVQFYFLKFATDVLLLPPLAVGVVFALGRAWDALSDPLVGNWSDRTRTRLGRRRPWMLAGIPVLMGSAAMIWMPPQWSTWAVCIWCGVALFVFYSGFTMYMVPHTALGAELTDDHHDRSRIFGTQSVFFTLGMLGAFAAMGAINNAPDPRAAAAQIVGIGIVVGAAILLVAPVRLRERPEFLGRSQATAVSAMRDVLRNPHARLLLTAQFVQMAGGGVLGIMSPYLLEYVVERPDLIAQMPAIFVLCTVLSIPIWIRISRRFGKARCWTVGMFGTGIAFGMILFVGKDAWVTMGVVLVMAGFFSGSGMALGTSILADVIDSEEQATGERKEGAYSAAWGFAVKASSTLVIIVMSAALQFSDFEPNQKQSEATLWMLRFLNGAVPLVMYSLGALIFRRFTLDEAEHAAILAELDRGTARE